MFIDEAEIEVKSGQGGIAWCLSAARNTCRAAAIIIQVTHGREIAGMSDEVISLRDGVVIN